MPRRADEGSSRPSRRMAVVVLVVLALVILVAGVVGMTVDGKNSSKGLPVKLLPVRPVLQQTLGGSTAVTSTTIPADGL
ncbi:MAG: hypothetical protein ACOX8V_04150 [Thermoleophilia bacterium]